MKHLTLSLHDYTDVHSALVIEAIEAGATSESHGDDPSKIVMTFASKAKADAFSKAIGHDAPDDHAHDEHNVAAPVHETVSQDDTGE